MNNSKTNNRLNNIIKDLYSDDQKKVLIALTQMRKHGKKEAILPLIEKFSITTDDEIKSEILSLFYDLKDQTVSEEIILAIENDKFIKERNTLISIFWQAAIDGSPYISNFINAAIKGDYLTCVEVLTIIETFDTTFDESEIEDLKYDLDEAIELADTDKSKLLLTIKAALESLTVEY